MAVGTRMQQRRATEAVWNTSSYVLAAGELGVATDTGVIKFGDGSNEWSDLDPALGSEYLPLLGKAADSELLDGISSGGFLQLGDATTTATADKVARRLSDGKLKAAAGASSDDVVNYTQMTAADSAAYYSAVVDGRKETVSRSVTAAITLQDTDAGCLINISNTSYTPTINCTIPTNAAVSIPVGSFVDICSTNKGTVTLVPASGVTLNGPALLYGEYSIVRIVKTATDVWQVTYIQQSPGPVLRRICRTPFSLTNVSHTVIPLDGSSTGMDTYSVNYDSLGSNEQWSSGNVSRAYARRSGWYNVDAQFNIGLGGNGRGFVSIYVNGVNQYKGRGLVRSAYGETTMGTSCSLPLNVGDYVEMAGYQDEGSAQNIGQSPYSASFFEWRWVRPL